MPVTLAKMASNTASLTLPIGEDSVTIVYYPNRVTDKAIAALDAGLESFNEALASLIKEWDVLEEDGSMFPLDRLAELGLPFRVQVSKAIIRDMRPN